MSSASMTSTKPARPQGHTLARSGCPPGAEQAGSTHPWACEVPERASSWLEVHRMSAALRASAMAPRDRLDTTPTAGMWRAGSSGQRVLITHLRAVTRWQRYRPRGRSRRGISAAGSMS